MSDVRANAPLNEYRPKPVGSLHFRLLVGPSGPQDPKGDIFDDFNDPPEVEFQITIGNECRTLISWVGSSIGGHLKEVRVLVRAERDRDVKRLDQEAQMASFVGQVVGRRPKPLRLERVLECGHNGSEL